MFVSGTSIAKATDSVVCDREGMLRLAEEWNTLAERAVTPLVSHEWFLACAEAFCPPFEISIFTVNEGGVVRAIAPCASTQTLAGSRFEILGSSIHREPSGMLYDTVQSLNTLLRKVIARRRPIQLIRMSKHDAVDDLLRAICQSEECFLASHETCSPWLPITSNWEKFESGMSSSRRNSLKRCRKRAEQSGKVSVEIMAVPPEDIERQLDVVVRVEEASWKGKKGTAIAQMPRLKNFFSSYATVMASHGAFVVGILRVDDKPIAALMGVIRGNRFWLLKTGYDESWSRTSPGILLLHESIRWAFEHGMEAYEFLGYDEPWLHMWTEHLHHYTSYYIYPKSFTGMLHLWSDAAAIAGRKLSAIEWNKS